MDGLLHLAFYNPSQLSDEDFLAGFVARTELLDKILRRLEEIPRRGAAQHRLLVGQRGMGKTSLLRRIALGVRERPELAEKLLPLTFREEQYNVHNLHILWCNCLDSLADWLESAGRKGESEALDREIAALGTKGPDSAGEEAHRLFRRWTTSIGLRPLLLLDNVDIVFGALEKEEWALRRVLQSKDGPVVIGASTTALEATARPEGAFYDFFQIDVLKKLGAEELRSCLYRLAEHRGESGKAVLEVLSREPERIRALFDLTGGNPRTLVMLYVILEDRDRGDVMRDLERLLDQATPLYKSRIEELAQQSRVVFDAVALAWDPITAALVADTTNLGVSAVSSHLDRLTKDGILEKVSLSTTPRASYQVAERFFGIWYLMRHGSRRIGARLRWLTELLVRIYSPTERHQLAKRLFRDGPRDPDWYPELCVAFSGAVESKDLRRLLFHEAFRSSEALLASTADLRSKLDVELLPPSTADGWAEEARLFDLAADNPDRAEESLRKAIELDPGKSRLWVVLGRLVSRNPKRLQEAEVALRKAIEIDPRSSAARVDLGILLADPLHRSDEAEAVFRKAIEIDPKFSYAWVNLGILLANRHNRFDEAEAAFRKAIEIDPVFAAAWRSLGILLANRLYRFDEAETAYRKAIEIDPNFSNAWLNLGILLANRPHRLDEAETAYRKVIEIDPKFSNAWLNLGILLANRPHRLDEAEAAFRKAIEIDPRASAPWHELGHLLAHQLGRHDEAETAYRKAIEIDPDSAAAWGLMGFLLANRLDRCDEAETAYRKAIELDPKSSALWSLLGRLLFARLGRLDEAEVAFRRAIEIDPLGDLAWDSLGSLQADYLENLGEAEAAYRTAHSASPKEYFPLGNLAFLLLAQPERTKDGEQAFREAIEHAPPVGAELLRCFRALVLGEFQEATEQLLAALAPTESELFTAFRDDLFRVLRMAAARGYAEELLDWFVRSGMRDRYWPLFVAFDAFVHGEQRLGDVNPEVRGAATELYRQITAMRTPIRTDTAHSAGSPSKKTRKTPAVKPRETGRKKPRKS